MPARGVVARIAVAGLDDRRVVAVHDAQPQRLGMRRAEQPRRAVGVGRAHGAVGDPRVAEPRVAEQRVVGLQQPLVAAPVDLERGAGAGAARGLQVGVDVGAAERVDRLLGVADEHERRPLAEGQLDDLPLHRVGVLELVDEHDAEALAQAPHGDLAAGVGEDLAQPREQVVVGHDREPALADVELRADRLGEPAAHARHRLRARRRAARSASRGCRSRRGRSSAPARGRSRAGRRPSGSGAGRGRRRPPRRGRRCPRRTSRPARRLRPRRARPAPPGRSRAWWRSWRCRSPPARARAGGGAPRRARAARRTAAARPRRGRAARPPARGRGPARR